MVSEQRSALIRVAVGIFLTTLPLAAFILSGPDFGEADVIADGTAHILNCSRTTSSWNECWKRKARTGAVSVDPLNVDAIKSGGGSFQPSPPIRAAFFYPWFPLAWVQQGFDPFTNYTPSLGFYDSQDDAIIDQQLRLADRAGLDAFIASWWGPGHHTDVAFRYILSRSERVESPYPELRWAAYYEQEGSSDPSPTELTNDLQYLADNMFLRPGYLKVDGRPVVFVWADAADGAGMADRWAQAADQFGGDIYVVLKVFPGYRDDPNQPDSWHQYAPAVAYDAQLPYSATVSPGFWKPGESPRLTRDSALFSSDLEQMASSGAFWHLITTWNEWGEGTAVEPAEEFGDTYISLLCESSGTTPCDEVPDTDGDGCSDVREQQIAPGSELTGGLRDPFYFWDFFDVWTGLPQERNGAVSVADIGAIVARFGAFIEPPQTKEVALQEALITPSPAPAYHAAFDRGAPIPNENLWDLRPPDGTISIVDIGAVVAQFGHTCA